MTPVPCVAGRGGGGGDGGGAGGPCRALDPPGLGARGKEQCRVCDGLYTFPSNPVEAFAGLLEEEDWSGLFQEWTIRSRTFLEGDYGAKEL